MRPPAPPPTHARHQEQAMGRAWAGGCKPPCVLNSSSPDQNDGNEQWIPIQSMWGLNSSWKAAPERRPRPPTLRRRFTARLARVVVGSFVRMTLARDLEISFESSNEPLDRVTRARSIHAPATGLGNVQTNHTLEPTFLHPIGPAATVRPFAARAWHRRRLAVGRRDDASKKQAKGACPGKRQASAGRPDPSA